MAKGKSQKQSNGSNLDFEAQLWSVADLLRGDYKQSECGNPPK
jgi:hypothetical protein